MKMINRLRLTGKIKDMVILIFLFRVLEKRTLRNFQKLGVKVGNHRDKRNDYEDNQYSESE